VHHRSAGLRARLATSDDVTACAAIYRPYVERTAVSFEASAPDAAEMAMRMARVQERSPWVVVEMDGVVRGYAYGSRHRERPAYDWTVETTVYVDPEARGRGVGRAAMAALLAILRLQGFHLAVAGITLPNPASVGLHLALGFERVGRFDAIGWKHGTWHATEWYGLELGPRGEAPTPIRPLPEIRESAAVRAALAGTS
jgi:L-amino acid N-acyltransferase YncA